MLRSSLGALTDEAVKPAEHLKVPLKAVPMFQHPVVFVWEDDQSTGNSLPASTQTSVSTDALTVVELRRPGIWALRKYVARKLKNRRTVVRRGTR